MATGEDGQTDQDARPQRPATRAREPSPIDAQRQPANVTRAVSVWRAACLAGVLALVTAALWRDARRDELLSVVGSGVVEADREQAVTILVIATFVVLVVLLGMAAALTARLPRGGAFTRVVLTVIALLQAVVTPVAVQVLTALEWEGFVTAGLLTLQAVLAVIGAFLMWMRGARRE